MTESAVEWLERTFEEERDERRFCRALNARQQAFVEVLTQWFPLPDGHTIVFGPGRPL